MIECNVQSSKIRFTAEGRSLAPVGIEYDDGVSGSEVDAQSTGARGQQEGEIVGAFRIEVLHGLRSTTRAVTWQQREFGVHY